MDIKDMFVEVVYERADGLSLLEIVEATSKRFQTQVTTRQVDQIIRKNPRLFVEKEGKIRCPAHF